MRIAPEYSVGAATLQVVFAEGKEILEDALGYDNEDDAIDVQPDFC